MNKLIMTLLLIAAILDGMLTRFALILPGLYEGNPLARGNMDVAYVTEIAIVGAYIGIYGVAGSYPEHNILGTLFRGMRASVIFGVVLLWFAVLWNTTQILLTL